MRNDHMQEAWGCDFQAFACFGSFLGVASFIGDPKTFEGGFHVQILYEGVHVDACYVNTCW